MYENTLYCSLGGLHLFIELGLGCQYGEKARRETRKKRRMRMEKEKSSAAIASVWRWTLTKQSFY